MDIAFILGSKIVELTLIVLMGYGLVKAKLLKSEDSKPLSIIGLYIISPAVMIEAFQISYTPEILEGLMLSFGMAVFLHGMLVIICTVLKRMLKLDPIEHAASIYTNSGNLIIRPPDRPAPHRNCRLHHPRKPHARSLGKIKRNRTRRPAPELRDRKSVV